MRGIILDVKKHSMIVLTNDNQYMKVKTGKRTYGIGDEIQFPAPERSPVWQIPFIKPVLAGVALCAVLVSIYPKLHSQSQTLPTEAYVSVDINPSLEIGIDSKLQVESIHPFNEDGSKVASQITNWKGKSLQDVVGSIIQISDQDGFLRGDRDVLLSTNMVNQDSSFVNSLNTCVKQLMTVEDSRQHVTIQTMMGSSAIRNTSKALGVSEGKYMLYENAKQHGMHVTLQHIKETSIAELDRELRVDVTSTSLNQVGSSTILQNGKQSKSNGPDGSNGERNKTDEKSVSEKQADSEGAKGGFGLKAGLNGKPPHSNEKNVNQSSQNNTNGLAEIKHTGNVGNEPSSSESSSKSNQNNSQKEDKDKHSENQSKVEDHDDNS